MLEYEYSNNIKLDKEINISIYRELVRYKIIQKLIKIFIIYVKKLNESYKINLIKLFKYNKIYELIQSWCWTQYDNNTEDSTIPYLKNDDYNFNNFVDTVNFLLKTKLSYNNSVFVLLKKNVSKYLKKSYQNFKNLANINIPLNKIIINDEIILSVMYDDREHKIICSNLLYSRLYNKLKINNLVSIDNYDIYIFCLIFRYSYLDSGNQQLAINSNIKYLFKKCNVNFELYGSAINTISDYYCSLWIDIERYFGSQGNFFEIKINKGVYWCNPPYLEIIMENTSKKIINILNNKNDVAFIITIPVWDIYTKNKELSSITRHVNKHTNQKMHKDYKIYYHLKPFIKDELFIPKFRIPYFNHKQNKKIFACNTYMILVYNNINNNVVQCLHNIFNEIVELDKKDYFINDNVVT